MTKKKEHKPDELLKDLENMDKVDDPTPAPENPKPEETHMNVVDAFANGDIDYVKQQIQQHVIKTVSNVVNGEPASPPPASEE